MYPRPPRWSSLSWLAPLREADYATAIFGVYDGGCHLGFRGPSRCAALEELASPQNSAGKLLHVNSRLFTVNQRRFRSVEEKKCKTRGLIFSHHICKYQGPVCQKDYAPPSGAPGLSKSRTWAATERPFFRFLFPILWMEEVSHRTQETRYGDEYLPDLVVIYPFICLVTQNTQIHTTPKLVSRVTEALLRLEMKQVPPFSESECEAMPADFQLCVGSFLD